MENEGSKSSSSPEQIDTHAFLKAEKEKSQKVRKQETKARAQSPSPLIRAPVLRSDSQESLGTADIELETLSRTGARIHRLVEPRLCRALRPLRV